MQVEESCPCGGTFGAKLDPHDIGAKPGEAPADGVVKKSDAFKAIESGLESFRARHAKHLEEYRQVRLPAGLAVPGR